MSRHKFVADLHNKIGKYILHTYIHEGDKIRCQNYVSWNGFNGAPATE